MICVYKLNLEECTLQADAPGETDTRVSSETATRGQWFSRGLGCYSCGEIPGGHFRIWRIYILFVVHLFHLLLLFQPIAELTLPYIPQEQQRFTFLGCSIV